MAYAGHKAYVTLSGTGVALSTAAMVAADGKTFQVSASSAQGEPFDPTASITVKSTSATLTSTQYTAYRLNGTIILNTSSTGSYTISTTYLPTSTVGNAHAFSYTVAASNLDVTTFDSVYRSRIQSVLDVSGSLDEFWSTGNARLNLAASSSQPVALSFYEQSTSSFGTRCWAYLSGDDISAAVDAVVDQSVGFEGTDDADKRVVTFTTRGTSG